MPDTDKQATAEDFQPWARCPEAGPNGSGEHDETNAECRCWSPAGTLARLKPTRGEAKTPLPPPAFGDLQGEAHGEGGPEAYGRRLAREAGADGMPRGDAQGAIAARYPWANPNRPDMAAERRQEAALAAYDAEREAMAGEAPEGVRCCRSCDAGIPCDEAATKAAPENRGSGPVEPEAVWRLAASLEAQVRAAIAEGDSPGQSIAEYADYCANVDDSEATTMAAALVVADRLGLKAWPAPCPVSTPAQLAALLQVAEVLAELVRADLLPEEKAEEATAKLDAAGVEV